TGRHHLPDPLQRTQELVHGIRRRHLLPTQNQHNHDRPRQHPHAREVRGFHPKLPHNVCSAYCFLHSANNRYAFFSIMSPTYCRHGGNSTAAVNLMSLPCRGEERAEGAHIRNVLLRFLTPASSQWDGPLPLTQRPHLRSCCFPGASIYNSGDEPP